MARSFCFGEGGGKSWGEGGARESVVPVGETESSVPVMLSTGTGALIGSEGFDEEELKDERKSLPSERREELRRSTEGRGVLLSLGVRKWRIAR
jgi:hypothetical protein